MAKKHSSTGNDGNAWVLYLCLRVLIRLALPLSLAGVVHIIYTLGALPWVQAKLWILPWLMVITGTLLLSWIANLTLQKILGGGALRKKFNQEALSLFEKFSWRFMIDPNEVPVDATLLEYRGRKALLILTNQRLIVSTLNFFQTRIDFVTDCERFAITKVTSSPLQQSKFNWLTGAQAAISLQLTIAGVKHKQLLRFIEPNALKRFLTLMTSQPNIQANKNGIRKIIFSAKRNALKRSYVENLFPPPSDKFNTSIILSVLLPGLGQIGQQRFLVGLTFLFGSVAWLAGSFQALQFTIDSGQSYLIIAGFLFLIWLLSLIDLFVYRSSNLPIDS